ncbi:MAG: right-handed parallel beta-helix repeat-containing protein, partial [Spirochaetes bacterium]|nr:right-handed parallel beta-helix repeat-containing protein [Spirochaetota bacterium]
YLVIRGVGSSPSTGSVIDSGGGAGNECFNIQNSKNIKVLNLHLKAASANNILIDHCSNVIVSNCYIKQSSANGIRIVNSSNTTIIENKIGDNSDPNNNFGILVEDNSGKNYIFNNEIWKNKYAGIEIRNASSDNTILSNQVHDNGEEGIKIHKGGGSASLYTKIIGNRIYNNNSDDETDKGGIRVIEDSDYTEIRDNRIYANKHEWNIGIKNARNCIIKNNTVYNCSGSGGERVGMGFWFVTNSVIISNEIYGNTLDGIKMTDDSIQNRMEYNVIYSNGQYGIYINVNSHDNRFFRNLIYNNNLDGVRVGDNSSRASFINNTFFKNGGRGIIFNNATTTSCTLRNCISQSNGDEGIRVVGNPSPYLVHTYNNSYGNNVADYQYDNSATDATEIIKDSLFQSTDPSLSGFLWISSNSPCTNAGDPNDPVPTGGEPRVDIGRYEYMTNGSGCVFLYPFAEEDTRRVQLNMSQPLYSFLNSTPVDPLQGSPFIRRKKDYNKNDLSILLIDFYQSKMSLQGKNEIHPCFYSKFLINFILHPHNNMINDFKLKNRYQDYLEYLIDSGNRKYKLCRKN